MELTEGVYENLISRELSNDIGKVEQNHQLVSRKKDIDQAEASSMLSKYIAQLVDRKLSDESLSTEEKVNLANDIIGKIDSADTGSSIANRTQMLTSMLSPTEDAAMRIAKTEPIRPLSGFRVSNLFTGGNSTVSLGSEIVRDIASANRISLIVSFLKLAGVNLIYDALHEFCSKPGHQLRIITTTYCGITEAKAVERLAQLPNTQLRISYNTRIERLHAKAYIFERNSGMDTAYIGSSNLSKSAQTDGLEWNIRVTNVENPHIIRTALANFDMYWNSRNFEDFKAGGIKRFNEQMRFERLRGEGKVVQLFAMSLLPHQKQIIDRLAIMRQQGINRNLIVAATGTGKTVVSAFDYSNFAAKNPHHSRLLFVAHREEILKQAIRTYRSVLGDANFGELWVGSYVPEQAHQSSLFVSVQTLNSNIDFFNELQASHFDYIVVDEAHHIAADSYRNILKFSPKLLIGLTATPERMDGKSLLPDFCNTISAEIRLTAALDEGLLTPFQYLCISDNTDLSDDSLMQGDRYIASKLTPRLCSRERVKLIVDKLRYYLADEHKCRALCFCATQEHAEFTAQALNEAGLKAASLTAKNTADRDALRRSLKNGTINYLCVVDIFNEGVDIPEVDTVLFLRPTESLTVFLQQLGRGLRLAPGKQVLTVMDFVAQLNKHYNYVNRFRSLVTHAGTSMVSEVRNGFTSLPHGCSIHMEPKAQKYVLESIKNAIYNKRVLIKELIAQGRCTLSEFVTSHDIDARLIYAGSRCLTSLKREAGLCNYADDDTTRRLTKGIGSLCHINSVRYLEFIKQFAKGGGSIDCDSLSDDERAFALMLYYALFQDTITSLGVSDIYQALNTVSRYPLFVTEIAELTDYLLGNLNTVTYPVGEGMPSSLELYGCYSREEIFILLGMQTATKRMQGSVSGVVALKGRNTEVFFVTLNKSDRDFSPSTLYNDYVMGEYAFHWQSQNTDSHDGRGSRFVNQKKNGSRYLLFVREQKQDGYHNTCPFHCFGFVDYVRSTGDRPMNIEWQLHRPVMPMYLKSV